MYEKITLKNGVRILFENIPYVRSVSVGIWVGTGSRFESAAENGASHFIEHMVFKGTETRTAAETAEIMDSIGGQINAFTTKECTCFYGRVLDTHLDRLTDILSDMFFNSRFDEADINNERGVIFEEIDMYEDAPEDLVTERLFTAAYKGFSLARPILGKKATLSKLGSKELREYMRRHYCPSSVVVAVSGSFRSEDIDCIASRFEAMPIFGENRLKSAAYTPAFIVKKKSIEQNHLCLGFPGLSVTDNRRYAMQLLSGILGGGMSSRLFQSVREKRGLCYSVYSFGSSYIDTGLFAIYTALGRDTEREALSVIREEVERFKSDGITASELDRAREQAKANVLMSLESTSARMNRLGKSELYLGKVPDPDEIIKAYDAVTADNIAALAQYCLDFEKVAFSAVGRVDTVDMYRDIICK
ncbi:MAG: M16 family metallopeptidase [Oscillospiraceae bacterium]